MKITICNAFSLNMVDPSFESYQWNIRPVDPMVIPALLEEGGFESAVGHADTAKLFTSLLGVEVPCNRATVGGCRGKLLVGQYSGPRLPEGTTTLPEGAKVVWWLVEWWTYQDDAMI